MPKISVIVPLYRVEKYIERCVRSLFEQTLDDIEYIFINDCSPDNSVIILTKLLKEYPQRRSTVQIINFTRNQGAAEARKVGISLASGEYVIHCDSDDWVATTMYEKLYTSAKLYAVDMVICGMYESNGMSEKVIYQDVNSDKERFLGDLICRKTTCSLCNKLIKREIVQSSQLISPEVHMLEDQLLCVQYLVLSANYIYIDQPLYYYFVNENSVCHYCSVEACLRRAREAQQNINKLLSFLEQKNLSEQYRNEIVRMKYTPRVFIWPLVLSDPSKYIHLWRNIFPEINCDYLFCKGIPFSLKLIFYLTLLRIYPIIWKVLHRNRKNIEVSER